MYRICTQKWDWGWRPREKERKIVNYDDIYQICVGTGYKKHAENSKQHRKGENVEEMPQRGLQFLSTMHVQV
jgi:hypothetical protein